MVDWFKKNMGYIIVVLIFLLLMKSCQSCNRDMTNKKIQKECTYAQDSLKMKIVKLEDSIKDYKYKLQIANEIAKSADRRAESIQETATKIKQNTTTTIKIENKSQDNK